MLVVYRLRFKNISKLDTEVKNELTLNIVTKDLTLYNRSLPKIVSKSKSARESIVDIILVRNFKNSNLSTIKASPPRFRETSRSVV